MEFENKTHDSILKKNTTIPTGIPQQEYLNYGKPCSEVWTSYSVLIHLTEERLSSEPLYMAGNTIQYPEHILDLLCCLHGNVYENIFSKQMKSKFNDLGT